MKILAMLMSLFISACSNIPTTISHAPIDDIQITDVSGKISTYTGQTVRWGGIIIGVDNENDTTGIQVLSYPLGSYGRPSTNNDDTGRFYFKTQEFLDPAVYQKGAEVTVSGILNGEIDKKVGNKTLTIPVIDSQYVNLWRPNRNYNYAYSGYPHGYSYYGYSPFYGHNYGLRSGYRHSYYGFGGAQRYRACY